MPPIEQLQRPPLVYVDKLLKQGIFTTGLLLEVSETPTRRQYLADQIDATTNDVNDWRDEALLLNLASFGSSDKALLLQAGVVGRRKEGTAVYYSIADELVFRLCEDVCAGLERQHAELGDLLADSRA